MKLKVGTTAAVVGAFAAGIIIGPQVAAFAQADGGRAETYRLLQLFGDVFARVRAEYVEPVQDRDLVENASERHADGPGPAQRLPQPAQLPRHAGADARRVRRPRHRGDAGERLYPRDLADRRDARRPRRREARRLHHHAQRHQHPGPDPAGGRGADARRARHRDPPHHPPRGRAAPRRALHHARRHPPAGGPLPAGRERRRPISASPPSTSRPTPTCAAP
jgi:hypothetical protein